MNVLWLRMRRGFSPRVHSRRPRLALKSIIPRYCDPFPEETLLLSKAFRVFRLIGSLCYAKLAPGPLGEAYRFTSATRVNALKMPAPSSRFQEGDEEVLARLSESPDYEVGSLGTVLVIIPANDESQAAPAVRDGSAALILERV